MEHQWHSKKIATLPVDPCWPKTRHGLYLLLSAMEILFDDVDRIMLEDALYAWWATTGYVTGLSCPAASPISNHLMCPKHVHRHAPLASPISRRTVCPTPVRAMSLRAVRRQPLVDSCTRNLPTPSSCTSCVARLSSPHVPMPRLAQRPVCTRHARRRSHALPMPAACA